MKKGVSPVISYVMIIALVMVTTTGVYFWTYPHMQRLGDAARTQNLVTQMETLDNAIMRVANGEIGFKNTMQFQMPKGTLIINEEQNTLSLVFPQEQPMIGYVGNHTEAEGELPTTCTEETTYLESPETGITLIKTHPHTNTYKGSTGHTGTAEITLCYPNTNITWKTNCIPTKTAPTTNIHIQKQNTTQTGKTTITIDLC